MVTFAGIRCDVTGPPAVVFDSSNLLALVDAGTIPTVSRFRQRARTLRCTFGRRIAHDKDVFVPEKSLLLFMSSGV